MARSPFVRDEGKQRLGAAVKAIEARSSAEIVVAVQPWSSSWVEVDCGTITAGQFDWVLSKIEQDEAYLG